MNSPTWISEALARTIHDDQIARYGGSLGIRDESLFLASLDRPRNLFAYGDNPNLFDVPPDASISIIAIESIRNDRVNGSKPTIKFLSQM